MYIQICKASTADSFIHVSLFKFRVVAMKYPEAINYHDKETIEGIEQDYVK